MSRLLVTGLNPAWQKVVEFEQLKIGQVNRAYAARQFGSGKGLNAALALQRLGHDVCLLQILGGVNGHRLDTYCRDRGIATINVEVNAETRICSTLLDRTTGTVTELVEPFEVEKTEQVEARIVAALSGGGPYDALVISGTMPAGIDARLYEEIASRVAAPLTVLDVVREMSMELLSRVQVVKVNAHEFGQLQNRGLNWKYPGLSWPTFFVTDGPRGARMVEHASGGVRETIFQLPDLKGVQNPIGAGDTVTAYLTHCLLSGMPRGEAFVEALAAGSASCLTLMPGDYDEATRQRLARAILKA